MNSLAWTGEQCTLYEEHTEVTEAVIRAFSAHDLRRGVVIDIGCGEGRYTRTASRSLGLRYVGIDVSSDVLHEARAKRSESESWVRADASVDVPLRLPAGLGLTVFVFSAHLLGSRGTPTLITRQCGAKGLVLVGNHPATYLTDCLHSLIPELAEIDAARTEAPEDLAHVLQKEGMAGVSWETVNVPERLDKEKVVRLRRQLSYRYCSGLRQVPQEAIKRAIVRLDELKTSGDAKSYTRQVIVLHAYA